MYKNKKSFQKGSEAEHQVIVSVLNTCRLVRIFLQLQRYRIHTLLFVSFWGRNGDYFM